MGKYSSRHKHFFTILISSDFFALIICVGCYFLISCQFIKLLLAWPPMVLGCMSQDIIWLHKLHLKFDLCNPSAVVAENTIQYLLNVSTHHRFSVVVKKRLSLNANKNNLEDSCWSFLHYCLCVLSVLIQINFLLDCCVSKILLFLKEKNLLLGWAFV